MSHEAAHYLLLSSVSQQPPPSLCLLPSLILHVKSIFLTAEGRSYPPWLISIPSDPLVYLSLLSGGWHGLVMIFPLLRLLLSNPLIPLFVVGGGLWELSSCSTTYGKQTSNYCPNDHLHNSNSSCLGLGLHSHCVLFLSICFTDEKNKTAFPNVKKNILFQRFIIWSTQVASSTAPSSQSSLPSLPLIFNPGLHSSAVSPTVIDILRPGFNQACTHLTRNVFPCGSTSYLCRHSTLPENSLYSNMLYGKINSQKETCGRCTSGYFSWATFH